jgi:hypothetical protein
VAPHQYRWKKALALSDPAQFKTSLLITNDLEAILAVGQAETADVTIPFGTYNYSPGVSATYPVGNIALDYDLLLSNGKQYKSSSLATAGYSHWSNSKSNFVPGFKYYPGHFAAETADPAVLSFYNVSNAIGNISYIAGTVVGGEPAQTISHTTALVDGVNNYDLSTDANWAAWNTAATSANSEGFYFCVALSVTNGNYRQGYGSYIGLQLGPIELATPITWTRYSLWELMAEGEVAAVQFAKASRHNVTGNIVTLTNTTAEIYKGGSIYAARLPGNSYTEMGATNDDVIRIVSSQVDHVLESSELSKGMSYSFTPEKIQDWLFERTRINDPYQGNPENIPYCAVALDATGIDTSAIPTFVLTGVVSIEYLTTDPSNYKVSSPSQSAIFDAVLNALAVENCVSCNPDHWDHLKGVVDKVMNSENVKYALRSIISTGVKVAPFVLSML